MGEKGSGIPSVVREFICVDRLHHACVDAGIKSLGCDIHRTQHIILMHLHETGGAASQKEIADRFGISPAAVATTLKSLEERGYIRRKTDGGDSRRNTVELTDSGLKIVEKSHRKFAEADEALIRNLSKEELAALENCLKKMTENMREYAKSIGLEVRS
ncbi:MAG: MarR family transcriptional regulator [Clostridia bacterium]|nr:MarR family transcriptional regulator [Clostridia bacterium]